MSGYSCADPRSSRFKKTPVVASGTLACVGLIRPACGPGTLRMPAVLSLPLCDVCKKDRRGYRWRSECKGECPGPIWCQWCAASARPDPPTAIRSVYSRSTGTTIAFVRCAAPAPLLTVPRRRTESSAPASDTRIMDNHRCHRVHYMQPTRLPFPTQVPGGSRQ